MCKVILELFDRITFQNLASRMNSLQKRCASALYNLVSIKHNKEFCFTRGRVHLVFVFYHNETVFRASEGTK